MSRQSVAALKAAFNACPPRSIAYRGDDSRRRSSHAEVRLGLNIDIREFCRDMASAALAWLEEVEDTDTYKQNYGRFLQRYPGGLRPYIVGVDVIT